MFAHVITTTWRILLWDSKANRELTTPRARQTFPNVWKNTDLYI